VISCDGRVGDVSRVAVRAHDELANKSLYTKPGYLRSVKRMRGYQCLSFKSVEPRSSICLPPASIVLQQRRRGSRGRSSQRPRTRA
jgi:hypothetical protein